MSHNIKIVDDNNSTTPAKARWKLLSSVISSLNADSLVTLNKFSKRNHQGFDLFPKTKLDQSPLSLDDVNKKVINVTLEKTLTNSEIYTDKDKHTQKDHYEWYSYDLGGGMCALAGLFVATKCQPSSVTLTDDNPDGSLFLLCAPQRGGSLQEFISLLEAQGDFHVKLLERYDDCVWEVHQQSITENSVHYVPDIHYPLIVQAYWRV
ncbi:11583_t:CDS:2 [Racocetra fulgida]|uniref:11583_t:CDS:1 n=1 Tax=Racocetra fulgida TaxID=60492 RepID=A0A9N9B6D3_9GLOM|nr:11583_t:CDS:2 [Racocetra fulgida]